MTAAQQYHDFYAPIGGTAVRFSMRCAQGRPIWIGPLVPLHMELGQARGERLYGQLDLLNHLMKSVPWAALASCRGASAITTIVEAAEARRQEIYGTLESTP